MAYIGMAYIVMAYIVMAYIVMAYIVMAYRVMAYIVMAYIVMAYIVMASASPVTPGQHSVDMPRHEPLPKARGWRVPSALFFLQTLYGPLCFPGVRSPI